MFSVLILLLLAVLLSNKATISKDLIKCKTSTDLKKSTARYSRLSSIMEEVEIREEGRNYKTSAKNQVKLWECYNPSRFLPISIN